MSKTKHTESREDRELSVQELETVSGGALNLSPKALSLAWQDLKQGDLGEAVGHIFGHQHHHHH